VDGGDRDAFDLGFHSAFFLRAACIGGQGRTVSAYVAPVHTGSLKTCHRRGRVASCRAELAQLLIGDCSESDHGGEVLNRSRTPQVIERRRYAVIPLLHHAEEPTVSIVR
jgi:hypothetical protein